MKKNDPISQIMTKNVLTIQNDSNLHDVISLIRKHHIRHVPVLKGKKVVGIISRTDVNRLTFGALFEDEDRVDEPILNMLTIPQVMTGSPQTVNVADSIKKVAEVLVQADYHALPVEDDGNIVGIVTTTDLIRYLLDQY